jgi:hypothetical protein
MSMDVEVEIELSGSCDDTNIADANAVFVICRPKIFV